MIYVRESGVEIIVLCVGHTEPVEVCGDAIAQSSIVKSSVQARSE